MRHVEIQMVTLLVTVIYVIIMHFDGVSFLFSIVTSIAFNFNQNVNNSFDV
jgi:hypothetical protein